MILKLDLLMEMVINGTLNYIFLHIGSFLVFQIEQTFVILCLVFVKIEIHIIIFMKLF